MSKETPGVQPEFQPESVRRDVQAPAAGSEAGPEQALLRLQSAAGNGAVSDLLAGRHFDQSEAPPAWLSAPLDADLGQVALHRGPTADQVTGRANAHALTLGRDIFLAADTPPAHTPAGRHIIAHELMHVAQGQNRSAPAPTATLEAEAALGAAQLAGGRPVTAGLTAPTGAALALGRGVSIALGILGGLALGAAAIGLVAAGGGALSAGLIGGLLGGGAALGGLIGGLVGGGKQAKEEQPAQPAQPVQPAITASQAQAMTVNTPWKDLVQAARDLRGANETAAAIRIYQIALLKTIATMKFPDGVTKIEPTMANIRVDFSLLPTTPFANSADATTSPLAVEASPDNYWPWITFGPGVIDVTQRGTERVIFHELIHVKQFQSYWQAYKANNNGQSWRDYMQNMATGAGATALIAREELQAHLTILDYLNQLSNSEARTGVRALFVYYIEANTTVLPAGVAAPIDPTAATAPILTAFNGANNGIKDIMAAQAWWAMIRASPPAAEWRRIVGNLLPIFDRGYADPKLKPHYDALLKINGLTYAGLKSGGN